MKIILTENQVRKILLETIHPKEAHNDLDGLMTVIEGRRGLCSVHLMGKYEKKLRQYIDAFDLYTINVPSNPYNLFVVYADGYEDRAKELVDIAEKYNGYFAANAQKEDTIRIGELLEYDPEEIKKFIIKNYGVSKEKE